MSGIYIPIKVPKGCSGCPIDSDCCTLWQQLPPEKLGDTRPKGCPIVVVPDHGRLGDLNELFKRMFVGTDGQCYPDKDIDGLDHVYTFRMIKHEILSAPTIIPADLPVMYYPQVSGITPTIISDKEREG